MSQEFSYMHCVVCKIEGNTVKNPKLADIQELCSTARERVDLGELKYKSLVDFIRNIPVSGVANIRYHSECRKPIVNKTNLKRLRKRSQSVSSVTTGRPSITDDNSRPKRFKTTRKEVVCVFASCSFCPTSSTDPLHRAYPDPRPMAEVNLYSMSRT